MRSRAQSSGIEGVALIHRVEIQNTGIYREYRIQVPVYRPYIHCTEPNEIQNV